MKTKKKLLLTIIAICSYVTSSLGSDHITLTLANCSVTNNTITYDILAVNDGTSSLKFNSITTTINFNGGIAYNTVTPSYVAGSSDFPAAYTVLGTTYTLTYNSGSPISPIRSVILSHSLSNYPSAFAISLPIGITKRIGTFIITNSLNWTSGLPVNLAMSNTSMLCYSGIIPILTSFTTGINLSIGSTCSLTTPVICPTANAGGPYSSCGDINLNGLVGESATSGTWSSTGTGTFSPNANNLNAIYHPSAIEKSTGNTMLTLTSNNPFGAPCVPAVSNATVTFTSIDDANLCTTDACNNSNGLAIHTAVNTSDGNACTTDACNSLTGVTHTLVNTNDGNACTTDACNTSTGVITHTAVNIDDGNLCTTDACNTITGTTHSPVNSDDGIVCTSDGCLSSTGVFHNLYADCEGNRYNCYIKNSTQVSSNAMEFDIWVEWTGTNSNKLQFFQAGINFNYSGMANGGTVTGAFVPGSADVSLPPVQQNPNWNINQTSKQIRMIAALTTPSSTAVAIPGPPGFRLGTFRMSNTVPFAACSSTDFEWMFQPNLGNITKTDISCYIDGSTLGSSITQPVSATNSPANPFAIHTFQDLILECTTLQLNAFIEGFYIGNSSMRAVVDAVNQPTICDDFTIELHNTSAPYTIVNTSNSTLNIFGDGTFIFPYSVQGNSYYIVTRHRNALETWSALPVLFNNSVTNYNFTDGLEKGFENNQKDLGDGNFALYSGNLNSDMQINSNDIDLFESATETFITGYSIYDLNGDGIVESADFSLLENNLLLMIHSP